MKTSGTILEIQTLGRFNISVGGKPVATEWPTEEVKVFFCSILSPLDLYFTWDRVCRSMWNAPATQTGKRRLEESFIRPLNRFLTKEFGFNPLITTSEGIRLDHSGICLDALDFYNTVLEGLRLLSCSSNSAAIDTFNKAHSLYTGLYLPGIPGKITTNTRIDLESIYRTVVMPGVRHALLPI